MDLRKAVSSDQRPCSRGLQTGGRKGTDWIYEIRRTGVFYHYRWNDRDTGDHTAQLWHHYIRRKREASSEKLLSGAKLELVCKDTMEVISQWISDQENGQVFNGLEPGTYIIREIEAPAGYEKGKEMEIRILDQAETVQEFVFYNSRIRSSGGGGSHTVPKKLYISFKKTDEKENLLPELCLHFMTRQDDWQR